VRAVVLLVMTCACDRVLGLAPTRIADATPPPPPDAPPVCPAIGSDAPAFNGALISLGGKGCAQYSVSVATDTAMAVCTVAATFSIVQGSIGGMLSSSALDFSPAMVSQARISPEGDLAIVMGYDRSMSRGVIQSYARGPGLEWSPAATIDATSTLTLQISAPSRGPDHHVLALAAFAGPVESSNTPTAAPARGRPSARSTAPCSASTPIP
jgi:hypothetical protein